MKPGKAGRPNYYFSLDAEPPLADQIPPGFEIYENIRGQVFLRKIAKKLIMDEEFTTVSNRLRKLGEGWEFKAEIRKNMIIIHEAAKCDIGRLAKEMPWVPLERLKNSMMRSASYQAVFRFVLADPKQRLFIPERYCFRGSVDDWINLDYESAPLASLLKKYVKHLGQESMYDLI